MPFMDESMIDLFGEDGVQETIANALASLPETGSLVYRINQSHRSGCCQQIAWSRSSCVARLSDDGRKIHLLTLARNASTGEWSLVAKASQTLASSEDAPFVHIEWSNSYGLDLLAFDASGSPYWFTSAYAIGRLQRSPMNLATHSGDSHAVVGTHWLPVHPIHHKNQSMTPATRNDNDWLCKLRFHDARYLHNPHDGRMAFFTISRSNELRLIYQSDTEPWSEATLDLGDPSHAGGLISHAAFADGPDFVYLATHDLSRRLRLYKIRVKWNAILSEDNKSMTIKSAQIASEHIDMDHYCMPQSVLDPEGLTSAQGIVRARLSALSFLPVPSSDPAQQSSNFQILGVFTHVDSQPMGQQLPTSCSVIARWNIEQRQCGLHESFASFKSNNQKSSTPENTIGLNRMDDFVLPKIVLSTAVTSFEACVVLAFSDGSIEYRDRETLQAIMPDGDDSRVIGLPQTGFAYVTSDRCTDVALSYSACMAASMRSDGTVELRKMEYFPGWLDTELESYQTQAALICIAREFTAITASNNGPDEVLALVPPTLSVRCRRFLVDHMYRILGKWADVSSEEPQRQAQKVMRDNLLHRILGGQLILSYAGEPTSPDIPRKVIWVIQNLKTICTSIASTISPNAPAKASAVASLGDVMMWIINLQTSILADLIAVHEEMSSTSSTALAAAQTVLFDAPSPSPSLHLLLCSPSRALLRFVSDLLKVFITRLPNVRGETLDQSGQILQLREIAAKMPFRHQHFETLIADVDTGIRKAHASASSTQQARSLAEHAILIRGELPEVMHDVIENVITGTVSSLMDAIDTGAVFFSNWDQGLDFEISAAARFDDKSRYDVLRKEWVSKKKGLKRCRRCGSCTADTLGSDMKTIPPWVASGTRFCICSGHWTVV